MVAPFEKATGRKMGEGGLPDGRSRWDYFRGFLDVTEGPRGWSRRGFRRSLVGSPAPGLCSRGGRLLLRVPSGDFSRRDRGFTFPPGEGQDEGTSRSTGRLIPGV